MRFQLVILISLSIAAAAIINVPDDHPTIQLGINNSICGDTVLVQPGIYMENIYFNWQHITLGSMFILTGDTSYISQTIIDGNYSGSVVTMESGLNSTATLSGFTLINGSAFYGGGIYCQEFTSPNLTNLVIRNNTAEYGGGIYCWHQCFAEVTNVVISNNYASTWGGGLYCHFNSDLLLTNVMITENASTYRGGGIYLQAHSHENLVNVTIANNTSQQGGGSYFYFNCGLTLLNSIMWNNTPQDAYFDPTGEPNFISISYSDIGSGFDGFDTNNNGEIIWSAGNIIADPLFLNEGSHPYALSITSPCIDVGAQSIQDIYIPDYDIIGNPRIWDGDDDGQATIDFGAYEYYSPATGDVNMDGYLNILDIVLIIQCILGEQTENCDLGDINADGFVDMLDVVIIVGFIMEN